MQNGFVETLIGAAVVVVAAFFFYYGWNTTGSGAVTGYEVSAKFDRVDGIGVGTDVRMSGIKIGTVTSQELDQKSYRAELRMTIKTGIAHYWSRSRACLWRKGETSGNEQRVVEMRTDCDQDTLLLKVETLGDGLACHTGRKSCFYRTIVAGAGSTLRLETGE